ncbi:MAG: MurR/RpiR family transcriptional regulator [Hyphomicrobiales bacterium]|nr:MurR/RpiR family transcriptional regulator [Hyphomicrobiales bacterium]
MTEAGIPEGTRPVIGPSRQAVIDIISELRKHDGTFSGQEQRVADYIIANLERAAHQTLSEIAVASSVSVATVNRFCRSLGCNGFKDFKIRLAQHVAVSLRYIQPATTSDHPSDDLVDYIFDILVRALELARPQLDPEVIEKVIDALAESNRIVFLGVGGGSTNIASEGANRFFRLGIPTQSISDGFQQRMIASTLGRGDVVFAISSTGWPQELLDSVTIARQYGATTLCLTQKSSPLANACDLSIGIDLENEPDIFKPSSARSVFSAIVDVLAFGVARRNPNRSRENLRRIRSSLVALHQTTRPHPIGD